MTFSEQVKNEILSRFDLEPCCQLASLSAFVRGSGTLASSGGNVGFEIITENELAFEVFSSVINKLYGIDAKKSVIKDNLTARKKYSLSVIN